MAIEPTIISDVLGMFFAPALVPYAGLGVLLYVGKDIANVALGAVKSFVEPKVV